MDFNQYAYDKELAESGRRIDLDANSYLVICRWGNNKFLKRYTEMMKPYGGGTEFGKFQNRAEDIPDEEAAAMMRQLVAETILVDWGGMTDDGKKLPYSPKNAAAIFEKHPRFMADVMERSQDDATFRSSVMEKDLGNSEKSSGTSSASEDETEEP